MRRVISVFLPSWPTDRLRRSSHAAMPPDEPLITAMHDGRRQVIAGVDRAARSVGLLPGMPLARAQAMVPGLTVMSADPTGDDQALGGLAAWCLRYAPLTAQDRPAGLWIDATGVAHLFGGEAALLGDVVGCLARHRIAARAAIADTPGAAWAVARYAEAATTVVARGGTAAALRPLPLLALRLPAETVAGLARLGFECVGQLMGTPRAPLTRRFGPEPMRRLDQATGRIFEPIEPVSPSEAVSSRMAFPEPLLTPEAFAVVIGRLTRAVCTELERRGQGARRLDLVVERIDGARQAISIGTVGANREPRHLARLLDEQMERIDPGLGVEAMSLTVSRAENLIFAQPRAGLAGEEKTEADLPILVDRLVNRLGERNVYRVAAVESDVPERSVRRIAPIGERSDAGWPASLPRPVRLLKPPQPVDATAMLPDHPPAFFVWRRRRHRIRRADGPERIAGEWWMHDRERFATRDYWQVEDDDGRRFWLFRSGDAADPATGDLRWFLHGFF